MIMKVKERGKNFWLSTVRYLNVDIKRRQVAWVTFFTLLVKLNSRLT